MLVVVFVVGDVVMVGGDFCCLFVGCYFGDCCLVF